MRESQFKSLHGGAMDMTFSGFVEVFASEVKPRVREHAWMTKECIINDKLVHSTGWTSAAASSWRSRRLTSCWRAAAAHQQVVPEPPRRGHRDRPQDA